MGPAPEKDNTIDGDEKMFRGSRLPSIVTLLGSGYTGLLVTAILMRQPLVFFLSMVVGWTLGAAIVMLAPFSFWKKGDLVVRAHDLEGPVKIGIGTERRTVPLSAVDLAASRHPSLWRSGYLQLSDGSRMLLNNSHFNARQGTEITAEICRRQQRLAPGESL